MAEQKYDNVQDGKLIHLLIQGCTTTKGNVSISKKKGSDYNSNKWEDGKYLGGMAVDMFNMDEMIKENKDDHYWYNSLVDREGLTCSKVLDSIDELCQFASKNNGDENQVVLYYTGHGATDSGDWCFSDGCIQLKQIINIFKKYKYSIWTLAIYSDCCYSGNWALELEKYKNECNVDIYTASWPGFVAYDNEKEGGYFTQWASGKKERDDLRRCENSSWGWVEMKYYLGEKEIKQT